MSDVPRSMQSWVSTIQSVVLTADVLNFFLVEKRQLPVNTADWMVATQLCKLRGTSDTFVGRAYSIPGMSFIIWFLWTKPTTWLILSFTKKIYISFARVVCFILMKDIGRWLPWMLPGSTGRFSVTIKELKNGCEYDRLNGWNSTLQAAWYIRHVRWTCLFYISFIIWFLWAKPTIWLLILSFTKKKTFVRACCMFDPYEGYRSASPLDAARVNRTIFHNHSVHWYYITLKEGRDCIKHDIIIWHGQQNPHRGRWL